MDSTTAMLNVSLAIGTTTGAYMYPDGVSTDSTLTQNLAVLKNGTSTTRIQFTIADSTEPLTTLFYGSASTGGGGGIFTFTSSNGYNNTTIAGPAALSVLSIWEATIFAMLTSICIIATIFGNILVIMSVFTYRPLRCVQNFFIVSLACADLAVAILVMPFNVVNFIVGHWVFGLVVCDLWLTFDILTCTASILNLCAIALDRFYAIHDPINYAQKRTLRRVSISIAVVWVASALISIPPLIGWNNSSGNLYNEETKICQLTDEKSFVIYSASGSFFIPLFIMTFVYVKIFRATRRRLRQRARAAAAAKMSCLTGKEAQTKLTTADNSSTDSPEETGHNFEDNTKMINRNNEGVFNNSLTQTEHHDSTKRLAPTNNGSHVQVHQFLEERAKISLSKERRAARTLGIIMSVFVLCWLPFFLMYVVFPFCARCVYTDPRVINFIVWLGYINSSLNPIIYTIFNLDFRRAFKKILIGKRRR